MPQPDCQKYTLTVEAFRVVREDYAEEDVPKWAWKPIRVYQSRLVLKGRFRNEPPNGSLLGCWLITCPPDEVSWVTDEGFKAANFRRVAEEDVTERDVTFSQGFRGALDGIDVALNPYSEANDKHAYDCWLRGFDAGRAELEARR